MVQETLERKKSGKVWSDLKNNVKKKWAKINRAANGTGGGPAVQLTLTDLENRVMNIIGVQAATGMPIQEAGFVHVQVDGGEVDSLKGPHSEVPIETVDQLIDNEVKFAYTPVPEDTWNTPGTSSKPTVAPPPPPLHQHLQQLQRKPSGSLQKRRKNLKTRF